ncbi:uncharacterized protein PGTG_03370 [Puccinia graminis f. sp. tritici CRL 75-36-700-3]|uniref:Uncharacterized protein n=2 Tax=Puccinia graminis f. sp. tritici TaxID=56615 RepID=E3JZD9_PUCGT|nr:uncharacterized protein PGTG_03370 [Puccinia graminis f. sp. tritici CRL 75-36-700-3]EFP77414.2 hypothetical protein PGTG_03370 [Puccinia graminis f. sp. tritici CRL 75-36-700-3]
MGTKTMSIFAVILTPINIAQSYLTSSQRARVSAGSLPESVIEQLVELSGRTLQYKEMVVVVDYTVVSWIILILLLIGIAIETSKFSKPEYGDSTKEELSA